MTTQPDSKPEPEWRRAQPSKRAIRELAELERATEERLRVRALRMHLFVAGIWATAVGLIGWLVHAVFV